MTKAQHHDALRTLEQVFGDRVKRDPVSGKGLGTEDALASVLPINAPEGCVARCGSPACPRRELSSRTKFHRTASLGDTPG